MELSVQNIFNVVSMAITFSCSIFVLRKHIRDEKAISPIAKLTNDVKKLENKLAPLESKVEDLETQIEALEKKSEFLNDKLIDDYEKLKLHEKEISALQLGQSDIVQTIKESNRVVFRCLMSIMETEIENPNNVADKTKLIKTFDELKDHIIDK